MIIVITGNPGVGKHTVTKAISQVRDFQVVDINKIALDSGIYEKKDNTFDVDVTKLKKILNLKFLILKIQLKINLKKIIKNQMDIDHLV